MKTRLTLIFGTLFAIASGCFSQSPYYDQNNKEIPLKINSDKICIVSPTGITINIPSDWIEDKTYHTLDYEIRVLNRSTLTDNGQPFKEELFKLQQEINDKNIAVWPCYRDEDGNELIPSGRINVIPKQTTDTSFLKKLIKTYKLKELPSYPNMPEWSIYCIQPSSQNPLDIANALTESEKFHVVLQDFFSSFKIHCVNDPGFSSQWGLQNNDIENIDISACEAWQTTTGNNIKIAIIDVGIDLLHNDLSDNISPLSYDVVTGSSPSCRYGDHGTCCAGIAAAKANNGLGVAGVAPGAKLMSISHNFDPNLSSIGFADAIHWAWRNGADIISCSWGTYSNAEFQIVKIALDSALQKGRNGRGCVIVASSGNDAYNRLVYPANYPPVIAVGALKQDGSLAGYSNNGINLDVIAPGVQILTTQPNNNIGFASGTSSACPFVSGLAALILEVNPKLMVEDIDHIIKATTKKIPHESIYGMNTEHGTRNNAWGHGLINAAAAVVEAQTYCPAVDVPHGEISDAKKYVGCTLHVDHINIGSEGKLILDAKEIIISEPFSMEAGAQLQVITN